MSVVEISVNVASAGNRAGDWVDVHDYVTYDDFLEAVEDVTGPSDPVVLEVESSPFGGLDSIEFLTFPDVWDIYQALDDSQDPEAMAAYLAYHGWDLSMAEQFEDAYNGLWDSLDDYAKDFYEDVYGPFDVPGFSIEVDTIAWEQDHYTVDAPYSGEVYVFRYV